MQRFECKTGGSNKYYEFETVRSNGQITINGYYGAIGKGRSLAVIYDGIDEVEAQKALDKKIAEKLKHRYLPVGETPEQPITTGRVAEDLPVVWPMAAMGVENERQAFNLMKDPNYFAQEKIDGERCVVFITSTGLRLFSRSAGVADPTRPLEKKGYPHLNILRFPTLAGTILDSEVKDGKLMVFDVLNLCGQTLVGVGLEARIETLQKLEISGEHIVLLPYARTDEEKEGLLNRVMAEGGEGLMFKYYRGGYVKGGRPKGNWYKLKSSIQIDCVVMGFFKGTASPVGSIIFGQFVDGKLKELGRAAGLTLAMRHDMATHPKKYLGRVMTVRGQKRFETGALRHPTFQRFRDDKQPSECVWYRGEQ